ncbi:hypothetical protein Tco_1355196 [Tanacetum coccineum]
MDGLGHESDLARDGMETRYMQCQQVVEYSFPGYKGRCVMSTLLLFDPLRPTFYAPLYVYKKSEETILATNATSTFRTYATRKMKYSETLEAKDMVRNTWMAFGGNTRDLDSFGEETDKTMTLHQVSWRTTRTERGDGITSIKRRRCDLSSDDVEDFVTASEHYTRMDIDIAADYNLRELSGKEAWEAIENFAQGQKE